MGGRSPLFARRDLPGPGVRAAGDGGSRSRAVGLVVFESHHLVFRAEAVLKKLAVDYPFEIVPAPRQFSLSCAYALQVPLARLAETRGILERAGITEGVAYHELNVDK